jgi:hypothetical protein
MIGTHVLCVGVSDFSGVVYMSTYFEPAQIQQTRGPRAKKESENDLLDRVSQQMS